MQMELNILLRMPLKQKKILSVCCFVLLAAGRETDDCYLTLFKLLNQSKLT